MNAVVAAGILRERYGVTGPATVHETWGASVVVEIDGLFLKANGDRSTTAEALVAQWVRDAGVPAPEIIASGADSRLPGGTWIVMPRMPGTAMDPGTATPAQTATTIADVARHLKTLGETTLPGWGRIGDDGRGTSPSWPQWLRDRVADRAGVLGDRLPEGFLTSAFQAIDALAPEPECGAVLQADLGPAHILVDPPSGTVTGILDWADAVIGDPLFDIATFAMGGPAGDPIQALLQPQLLVACGADPADPRIALYRAVDHLGNAAWSVENDVSSWTDDLCRAAADLLPRV